MISKQKVVLFNGPPGSGKDLCADLLTNTGLFIHTRFKTSLYDVMCAMFGITMRDIALFNSSSREKEGKRCSIGAIDCVKTFGKPMSFRDALIYTSENMVKPAFGSDYFGLRVVDVINSTNKHVAVSDSGFISEVMPLIEAFGVDNLICVKLVRDGHTFANDSRSYLPEHLFKPKNYVTIHNNFSIRDLELRVMAEVMKCLKH